MEAVRITKQFIVTGCNNCPECKQVEHLGQGGFTDGMIYICEKGAYGVHDDLWGWQKGFWEAPKYLPVLCPYSEGLTGKETLEDLYKKYELHEVEEAIKKYYVKRDKEEEN